MPDPAPRSWKLRLRGDPTGTITHEYLCPEHGRFTAEVSRADVPDEMPCRSRLTAIDSVALYGTPSQEGQHCGLTSPWSPSGITGRVKQGDVVQGKVETNGLPPEACMDTRPLADGMSMREFKARRAKVHADLAIRKMRALTGRGGKVMR